MPGFDDDSGGLSPLNPKRRKAKASSRPDPERMLVQAASRIARAKFDDGGQRRRTYRELGDAFEGMDEAEVWAVAREANIAPADVDLMLTGMRTPGPESRVRVGSPWLLDLMNRPANAVKGAVVEAGGTPFTDPIDYVTGTAARGAWRGLSGKEDYAGTQGLLALGGVEKKKGQEIRESLPGPVRVAGDVAGDVILDPTNYVSFGAGAAAENAARAAAKQIAGDAANAVAMSATARGIYDDILRSGAKALSKEQRAALPKPLVRRLNRAQGGIRVAGKKLPGSQRLPLVGRKGAVKAGPKDAASFPSAVEQVLRPRAAVRAAERAQAVPAGTTQTVENLQARLRASRTLADMAERRVQRGAREAAAEAAGVTGRRATGRAGRRALEQVDLDRVRESLDVRGGQAAVQALPDGERQVAERLRALSDEDFAKLQETARLRSDEDVAAWWREQELHGDDIDLRDPIQQQRYFPHYPSKEAYDLGVLVPDRATAGLGGKGPGFLERRASHGTASDATLPGGAPARELDPIVAIGRHAKETVRDSTRVAVFDDLAKMPGPGGKPMLLTDPAVVGAVRRQPGWNAEYAEITAPVTRIGPDGARHTVDEAVLVRREIADEFQKVIRADLTKIRSAAAYLNALWARYATATTGFISRNVFQGNLYLGMVLAGANDPRVWARSLGTWKRVQQGIVRLGDPYRFLDESEKVLMRGALENNAVESGFLQTLAEASEESLRRGSRVGRAVRGSRLSPLSPNFYPIERISAANQWAENWSRLSVYANMVKKGYTPPEAAAIARKYLLDYGDLAPANDALRMVNPFITWTYKSAPLILGEMARDPKKINIPVAILNAFGAEGERSEGNPIMPEWMREAGGVTIPKAIRERLPGPFGDTPQVFLPDLPIYSAADTLRPLAAAVEVAQGRPGAEQRLGREAWNLLGFGGVPGGVLKSSVEAAAQQQLFSGRRFEPGQRVPTPAPLDKVLGPTMPWEQWNTLSALVPFTSRLAIAAPRSEYDAESQGRRVLSTLGGVGLFPNTDAQRRSEMYRRLDQLAAVTRSLRDSGVRVPRHTRTKPGGSSRRGGGTASSSSKGFG